MISPTFFYQKVFEMVQVQRNVIGYIRNEWTSDISHYHLTHKVIFIISTSNGHVVPPGVALEELKNYGDHSDHKKLRDECPEDVQKLMTEKDLFDRFVGATEKEKRLEDPMDIGENLGYVQWKQSPFSLDRSVLSSSN